MKNFILASFLFTCSLCFSQAYTPYEAYNKGKVDQQDLVFEKGDKMTLLVDNSTAPPSVYILENMTNPVYTTPVIPSNWSLTILYKDHKTVYHFNIGEHYRAVNDNNGCSYLELH